MKKTVLLLVITIFMVSLLLVGCGGSNSSDNEVSNGDVSSGEINNTGSNENQGNHTDAAVQVSKEKPMIINEENKTISVYATVNGKYLVSQQFTD